MSDYLCDEGGEGIFNVGACFGTSGEELDVVATRQSLPAREIQTISEICFVANKRDSDILLRSLSDLRHPARHMLERVGVRDIVHQQDTVCTIVKGVADSAELLLARCVPDLHAVGAVCICHNAILAVDTHSGHHRWTEGVFSETKQYRGFADAGVAQSDDFDGRHGIHISTHLT